MADVASTFIATSLATLVPLFLGLALPKALWGLWERGRILIPAVASGVIFWFFLDVMGDSTLLGISQGLNFDATHVLLILAFVGGLAFLFTIAPLKGEGSGAVQFTFGLALAVALGIGFHAFGEGMDVGAATPQASSILEAIGGLLPGAAYVIHKVLEGLVVGTFAALAGLGYKRIGMLGVLSGVPTIIGFIAGLPNTIDSSYFFALGGAGAVFTELALVPSLQFSPHRRSMLLAFVVGFFLMYTAGLLHA
jgi:ZIP family zinc transporter